MDVWFWTININRFTLIQIIFTERNDVNSPCERKFHANEKVLFQIRKNMSHESSEHKGQFKSDEMTEEQRLAKVKELNK